ncbi:lipopolysaccharide biosynthesis protein [Oecophyllibacter saccharovorans]|uniref:lipopolysaccharide biosynthesis protein n=1 Tax=Oecophyllibacter saccharovorans TaxID=2558360 RepID=UPI001167FB67|nr:oligosaccharide flippase family protein [Oecophyllibacter saccharovorans]TPW33717.1 hypothetical protein E3203_07895 [Oecophyllibacter saccharovorans]
MSASRSPSCPTASTPLSRIMGNASFVVLEQALNALCSFIYVPWCVQALGLGGFGEMLLLTSYLSLVSSVTHLQSWKALLHFATAPHERGEAATVQRLAAVAMQTDWASGLAGALLGAAGIGLCAPLLGWSPHLATLGLLCTPVVLIMNTGWAIGIMRLFDSFRTTTSVEFAGTCLRTLGCFIGWKTHQGLTFFLLVWCAMQVFLFLLSTLSGLHLLRRRLNRRFSPVLLWQGPWTERGRAPHPDWATFWKFTFSVSSGNFLSALTRQLSTLLIGAWLGAAEVAVFRVASQITRALAKPASVLTPALYPEFVQLRDKNDWRGFRKTVLLLLRGILLAAGLILLLALAAGAPLLDYMLHHHFAGGRRLITLLALSVLIDVATVPMEPVLLVMNQAAHVFHTRLAVLFLYVPLLYLLVRQDGIDGAAWASVGASMLLLLCFWQRTARLLRKMHARMRQIPPLQAGDTLP